MSQILVPIADGFSLDVTDQSGGTTNLYSRVDEAPATNDSDYIKGDAFASAAEIEFQLSEGVDPGVDTDHYIGMRIDTTEGPGSAVAVYLFQGQPSVSGELIAAIELPSPPGMPSTPTDYSAELGGISDITDYGDLWFKIVFNNADFVDPLIMRKVWLEMPSAPAGGTDSRFFQMF